MGHLSTFPVRTWSHEFGLDVFIETGSYLGAGLAFARQCKMFKEFHSIEINKEFFEEVSHMFSRDNRVQVWHGPSDKMLPQVLEKINNNQIFSDGKSRQQRIMFWLDAHLPSHYKSWEEGAETEEQVAPLKQELEIIRKMRPENRDMIIVDDLRLYAEDEYEMGNCEHRCTENIDWVVEMMGDAFEVLKSLDDEGYIILVPKKRD